LSLRMIEEMLAARGIDVSHETIRRWALKFGQEFANRCQHTSWRGLIHSRCSPWKKGEANVLKLLGVQTFSAASSMTLNRAAPPDRILTRSPAVTACHGRDLAPRVNQTLPRCYLTPCPSTSKLAGRRGITPAFGYSAPHPSAGGTLTLLIHALPSAQHDPSDGD
jgi:hypothetical protein